MKTKTVKMLVTISLSILVCGALLSGAAARGCTVFCDSQGDTVLAGYSFDIPDDPDLGLLFVPATAQTHGWVCGGRFAGFLGPSADGMNDQGLFAAVADVPTPADHGTRSLDIPADFKTFLTGLLGNCASVDEAITWCSKQPTPSFWPRVNQDSQGYYTFVTTDHVLVADRSGDSVVFEWERGKLKTFRKRGRYQLITNFLLSDPQAGSYPCPRYMTDSMILDKAGGPSLQTCRQVLKTTAQGSTRFSLICDLTHGDAKIYLRGDFDQPKTFHLADELQKGRHEIDLYQWFGRPKPEPLSPPLVIAASTMTAAEVLQRALAIRGGEKAAAEIHSLRGKGTCGVGLACLPAVPTEYFAMRPNRFRVVTDFTMPTGPDLGQSSWGFDGRAAWNTDLNGSCHILQGQQHEMRQDYAEFFGWYDEPGGYDGPGDHATVECLGEAKFDGKLCYDLKVVTRSRQEEFNYYDTTNFLLAGSFWREGQGGASWGKTIYSDYRAFDGFLIPTRIVWQDNWGSRPLHFESVEINKVTESDLRMTTKTTSLDPGPDQSAQSKAE